MPDPKKEFGITCARGQWYVCETTENQFIGCCTSNPCQTTDGKCPTADLGATSFDKDSFEDILEQDCTSNSTDVAWYTCAATDPTFMGCCSVNPCSEGECPQKSLSGAILSEKSANAKIFKADDSTTTSTSTASTSTATSGAGGDDDGLSHGAVAGIAAGSAIAGVLIIAALAFWLFKRKRRERTVAPGQTAYEPYSGQNQQGQLGYQENKFASPQWTPNSPNFPSPNPQAQTAYYNPHMVPSPPPQQQSPPYYTAQGHLSMSSYGGQGYTPTQPGFQENAHMVPPTAELPSQEPEHPSKRYSEMPAQSVTSYSGVGRESEVSGMTAPTETRAQQPVELEETTRALLRNDRT